MKETSDKIVEFKEFLKEDRLTCFFEYLSKRTGYGIKCRVFIEESKFRRYDLYFDPHKIECYKDVLNKEIPLRRFHTLDGKIFLTNNENIRIFFELISDFKNKTSGTEHFFAYKGIKLIIYNKNNGKLINDELEIFNSINNCIPDYFSDMPTQ